MDVVTWLVMKYQYTRVHRTEERLKWVNFVKLNRANFHSFIKNISVDSVELKENQTSHETAAQINMV